MERKNEEKTLYMASVVAHIIYAQKYLEKYPLPNGDRDEFLAGCVFPDIRRIDATLKRRDTHLRFEPVDLDFKGLTPFEAGWKFHLYCDMKREDILNKNKFYDLKGTTAFWNEPGKKLEDELVYDDCKNWEKIIHYFNNIPQIMTGIDVSRETFELWYAMIAKYIERKPCNHSISSFFSKQPSFAEKTKAIVQAVDDIRKNGKVIELLNGVKEEIV